MKSSERCFPRVSTQNCGPGRGVGVKLVLKPEVKPENIVQSPPCGTGFEGQNSHDEQQLRLGTVGGHW